jgi:hypothetical protein
VFRVCTPYEVYKCVNGSVAEELAAAGPGKSRVHGVDDFYQLLPQCSECKIECNRHVYHASVLEQCF